MWNSTAKLRITKAFGAGLVTTVALLLTCHRVTLLYNSMVISKSRFFMIRSSLIKFWWLIKL